MGGFGAGSSWRDTALSIGRENSLDDDLLVEIIEGLRPQQQELFTSAICMKSLPFMTAYSDGDALWLLRKAITVVTLSMQFDISTTGRLQDAANECLYKNRPRLVSTNVANTMTQMSLGFLTSNDADHDFLASQWLTFEKSFWSNSDEKIKSEWRRSVTPFRTIAIDDIERARQVAVDSQLDFWNTPLFLDTNAISFLSTQIGGFEAFLTKRAEWSFWREWYRGFLDGKPLDWALQKEIALIPDADWEKGPEWIAGKIEVIRKRRDLEAEIANLKLNLEKAKANSVLPNRLHNQPPEAVDDVAQMIVSDITLIWAQIEELEEEVAKPAPSPKVLIRIAKRLADMVIKIAKYCVSLGDIALKSIAKWAGPAVITSELAAPGTLQSVSKAILEFVKALPPG